MNPHTKRRTAPAVNLVERAVIAQRWREHVATARIHALMGENAQALVNQAGRVFFVVLGAAMHKGMAEDQREIRIIRGAVNATHDQAEEEPINPLRRASIHAGLEAAVRLLPELPHAALVQVACELEAMLRRQDVRLSDFEHLIGAGPAATSASEVHP